MIQQEIEFLIMKTINDLSVSEKTVAASRQNLLSENSLSNLTETPMQVVRTLRSKNF